MNTDKALNQVFSAAPAELYILLNLPRPNDVRARSEAFKELETTADLVVEPQPLDAGPDRGIPRVSRQTVSSEIDGPLRAISNTTPASGDPLPNHLPRS